MCFLQEPIRIIIAITQSIFKQGHPDFASVFLNNIYNMMIMKMTIVILIMIMMMKMIITVNQSMFTLGPPDLACK